MKADIIFTNKSQEPSRDELGNDHPEQHRCPSADCVAQTASWGQMFRPL